MLTLNDGRSELWQWDTGRTLAVDADCSQVHFSNKVFGRSIDVDVTGGVAIIPDILLQTDKDLNVWSFVGTAENGYTKISKTFKVNRRNKPADYVFTPVEQTTIAEIAAIAQSVRDDADNGRFDGKPGENGVTFTPSVSENGDLSWRNNGGLPNPQTVNILGPQGDSTEATAAANSAQTSAANAETHAAAAAASAAAAQAAVGAMGTELNQLKSDLSDLAPAGAAVGQLFRVAAISEDGKYTMEPVDMLDVHINGESIVQDGVAVLPVASVRNYGGIVRVKYAQGFSSDADGFLQAYNENSYISNRYTGRPLELGHLDFAVKAAICDGKGEAWTAEEQAAARERMGIPGDYEPIEQIALTDEVSEIIRDTDTLGNQYSMKNLLLFVSAGKTTLRMSIRIEINGKYIIDTESIGDNVYVYNNVCIFDINNGILSTFLIGNRGSIQNRFPVNSSILGMTTFIDTIKSVKLHIKNPIEGATIKIYGVRA